jgi:hypothetical protein
VIVYISVGNSDDKLTQRDWADFVHRVGRAVRHYGPDVHGFWLSPPDSPWQNACWCVQADEHAAWPLADRIAAWKSELGRLAREYGQESIAWAEAPKTEFLGEGTDG